MKMNGSCHCHKVCFSVDTEIENAITCDCSICHRKGTVLAFVPADKFQLICGETELTDYQFGKKSIHHYFCSTCGVTSFAAGKMPDGSDVRAVNLRCIDDFDLTKVKISHYHGKDL